MIEAGHNYPLDAADVKRLLQRYGITPTRQRIEIASYIFRAPQHLSADVILEGVNSETHKVSRATVYNTLGLFSSKGLVREVLIDRERVFYDSNNSAHHHVYNVDNGELHDIPNTSVEIVNAPEMLDGLKVVGTDVIIKVSSS